MNLLAGIRNLWHSIAARSHSDVEEEFRATLDAYQDDLIRQGLPEEEARRKARIDLGQPAAQYDTYRDAIGLRLFDELGGDIRYGLRALRRNPGFAAVWGPFCQCSLAMAVTSLYRRKSSRHFFAVTGRGRQPEQNAFPILTAPISYIQMVLLLFIPVRLCTELPLQTRVQ